MKKKFWLATVLVLAVSLISACGGGGDSESTGDQLSGKVVINGSSAMLPLMLQASKDFKAKHPDVQVTATGSSSIVGPQSVEKKTADIGTCDWDASTDVPGFKRFEGQVANKVAAIPFATVVHESNPIKSLTQQQLIDIFQGKVQNWKEVGGKDERIIVVNRAFGSGTRVNYQAKALNGQDFMNKGENYKEVKSSGDMATALRSSTNAIGYLDLVYVKDGLKSVDFNGVAATIENVLNKSYPVYGYAYMMTAGQPTGATKAFIEYVQSEGFQNGAVKTLNFIPLTEIDKS